MEPDQTAPTGQEPSDLDSHCLSINSLFLHGNSLREAV